MASRHACNLTKGNKMPYLNKIQIIGHLGKDPEQRVTQSGSKNVSFSVATSEKWKDRQTNEYKEKTTWHNVVYWTNGDYVQKYAKKGTTVYVEGKIENRKWTDKDGIERYTTEIIAQDVKIFRDCKSDNQQENSQSNAEDDFANDLPF